MKIKLKCTLALLTEEYGFVIQHPENRFISFNFFYLHNYWFVDIVIKEIPS